MNECHVIHDNDGKKIGEGISYSEFDFTKLEHDKIIYLRDISGGVYQIYREKSYFFIKKGKKLISARGLWQKIVRLAETMRLTWDKKTDFIIEIVETKFII